VHDGDPSIDEYDPAGHDVHAETPSVLNQPAGHELHFSALAVAFAVPAVHGRHVLLPVPDEYCPAGHGSHSKTTAPSFG
jgi:hypothetical protein